MEAILVVFLILIFIGLLGIYLLCDISLILTEIRELLKKGGKGL